MPPMPVPKIVPLSQSTRSSSRAGRSRPASFQASTATIEASAVARIHGQQLVALRSRLRRARRRPEARRRRDSRSRCSTIFSFTLIPDWPFRSASSKSCTLLPLAASTPRPVTTTRCVIASLPFRRRCRSRRRLPSSSFISASERSLRRRQKTFFASMVTRSPGFTSAAEIHVRVGEERHHLLGVVAGPLHKRQQIDAEGDDPGLRHRLDQDHARRHRVAREVAAVEVGFGARKR